MIPKAITWDFIKFISARTDDAGEVDEIGECIGINLTMHAFRFVAGRKGVVNRTVRVDSNVYYVRWAHCSVMLDDDMTAEIEAWLDLFIRE